MMPTRQTANAEIEKYAHDEQWECLHDHTEMTPDGHFFRMAAFQFKGENPRRRNIIIKTTTHWSEPVQIGMEVVNTLPQFSLNWGSGGIVSGLSNKELAHSMIAVWAWVQDYLNKNERSGQ